MNLANDIPVPLELNANLVSYAVRIDEVPVSALYHIISISIQEEINKLPLARIIVRDGTASKENFGIGNEGVFFQGKKIEISLGYNGDNQLAFKGMITGNTHKVYSTYTEMTVECKDERVKMTATANGRYFVNMTDEDIVQELLQNNGMPEVQRREGGGDAPVKYEQLVQANVTDWDFMISRIDVSGAMCLIHNGVMTMKKPDISETPALSVTYGANIFEFSAEMDARVQNTEIKTLSWDHKEQAIRETAGEEPPGIDSGSGEETGSAGTSKETIKDVIVSMAAVLNEPYCMRGSTMSEEEQQSVSNAKRMRKAGSWVRGKVKYQGNLKALPGSIIKLNGVGDRFNKNVLVSGLQHEYKDGGWTTEASIGWEEKFFAETTYPYHPASATGQVSTIQGLHPGVVTGIIDDTGEYRVKVRLPLVDNNMEGVYARVASLDAGDGRGTFFRPELHDEVLVGFMFDDPSHPVVLGMLHSSKKQSPLEPEEMNSEKGYVSRSGIRMIFNDEKKKFTITTPGEKMIELDDDAGTITIKDGQGNRIYMDQQGIRVETDGDMTFKAAKSISLEASRIAVAADDLDIQSNGNTTLKSSGNTEIRGSYVMIN